MVKRTRERSDGQAVTATVNRVWVEEGFVRRTVRGSRWGLINSEFSVLLQGCRVVALVHIFFAPTTVVCCAFLLWKKVLLRRNCRSKVFRGVCSKDARRSMSSGGDDGTDVVHVIFCEVFPLVLFLPFAVFGGFDERFRDRGGICTCVRVG